MGEICISYISFTITNFVETDKIILIPLNSKHEKSLKYS